MNKHVHKVIEWLEDPESVSQKEREENRGEDASACSAAQAAYDDIAANAAYAAAYFAAENNPELATKWVNKYFEITGENKQDYLDAIEVEKVGSKKEPTEEWVDGIPPLNSEVMLNYEEGFLFSATENEKVGIADDEVLIVTSIGTRCDNGWPVVTLMAKRFGNIEGFVTVAPHSLKPLKTQEEKDREAFIEICFSKSKRAQENKYITRIFEDLFNSGFKAPEEDK